MAGTQSMQEGERENEAGSLNKGHDFKKPCTTYYTVLYLN